MSAALLVERGYLMTAGLCGLVGAGGLVARAVGWETAAPRWGRWRVPGSFLTALVVTVWILRWIAAGHLPVFGTYESALSLAAAVMLASSLWELRSRFRTAAGPLAALVSAALLIHGSTFDPTMYALTISERSWVVDVHSIVAWAAFGVLTTNAALSLRELLGRGRAETGTSGLIARTLEIGFVLHTGMMISGSFYKFLLFGRVWSFDPIETMGFVAWISYGALAHMVRFAGWKGRRLAGWCLCVFVVLLLSYRLIVYFPAWSTYHIFDMDLRMHVTGG